MAVLVSLGFAIWPFVSFFAHNIEEGDYHLRIAVIGIAFAGLIGAAVLIAAFVVKGSRLLRFAYALGSFTVLFFLYGSFIPFFVFVGVHEVQEVWIGIWLIVAGMVAAAVWRLASYRVWRQAMLAALAVMFVLPLADIALYYSRSQASPAAPAAAVSDRGTVGPRRNVYWIVTDAYSRADVMKDRFGWDNRPFLQALRQRGFVIGGESWSNYERTKYSIAATMQMNYFEPPEARPSHGAYAPALRGFNATVDRFRSLGYGYVHAEPGGGITKTQCGGREDRCISPKLSGGLDLTEAEVGLLKLTPLFHLARNYAPDLLRFAYSDVELLRRELPVETAGPVFVFAHLLAPHPPARFNGDCSDARMPVSYMDGWTIDAYVRNVKCLNENLIGLVDEILREDETDPIIVISADHGNTFSGTIEPDEIGEPKGLELSFSILMAMRLPEGACRESFYPSISPVNQFRLVFGCLTGEPARLLADRHFLPTDDGFREVRRF